MLEWRQRNKTQITYKYGEQRHIKTMKKNNENDTIAKYKTTLLTTNDAISGSLSDWHHILFIKCSKYDMSVWQLV